MSKHRAYSKFSQEAAILLGEQIKLGRKQRRWSEKKFGGACRYIQNYTAKN
ncbi:hypothetical protein O185_18270 [Photorhabdus temperata J3]|uniref:Uncharacterized protein n=1 Tax=Photorhabdus temperata J3 TaxID=1389415 RepID=U7QWM6_PHOTE|nr:hypothetical protein O185_18270 [Photorhabdus temperata J3]